MTEVLSTPGLLVAYAVVAAFIIVLILREPPEPPSYV